MNESWFRGLRKFCLIFGVIQALWAVLWCIAGAGMYGSPLRLLSSLTLVHVLAFLLTGPITAFLASMVAFWRPVVGAVWLTAGGLASGVLACLFINNTGRSYLPAALVSLPMLVIGVMFYRASIGARQSNEKGIPSASPATLQDMTSALQGATLCVITFISTYVLLVAAIINNFSGLRGPPRSDRPLLDENQDFADGVTLLLAAMPVGLLTLLRRWVRFPWAIIVGMWLALLLGVLTYFFA